jgi:hypothetical protein
MRLARRAKGTGEADPDWVGWRDADLRERRGRAGLRVVRGLAWAIALTGFVVLLMDVQRDPDRCHPNCFDGSDHTFEPGHVWTAYAGSWQWDAQLVIGWAACLFGLWALYAAGRKAPWQTLASLGGAALLIAVWIVWLTVQPSPSRLAG